MPKLYYNKDVMLIMLWMECSFCKIALFVKNQDYVMDGMRCLECRLRYVTIYEKLLLYNTIVWRYSVDGIRRAHQNDMILIKPYSLKLS